jgi:hypothetical protein
MSQPVTGRSRRAHLRGGIEVASAATPACRQAAGGTGQPHVSKAPVAITYMSLGEPPRQQAEGEMWARFTAESPHLTVTIAASVELSIGNLAGPRVK